MAGTIQDKLQLLESNKAAIKNAIQAKNPTVMPTDVMSQWAQAITSIPSGGGSTPLQAPTLNVPSSHKSTLYGTIVPVEGAIGYKIMYANGHSMNFYTTSDTTFNVSVGVGYTYRIAAFAFDEDGVYSPPSNIYQQLVESGGGECFLPGTMITLSDMSQKPCECITYDDELLVWNFYTGKLDIAKPAWIKSVGKKDCYAITELEDGTKFYAVGKGRNGFGHRAFDVDKGHFIYTTETVGDYLFTLNGDKMNVCTKIVNEKCESYNIITKKHLNLFANGILTSCSLNNGIARFNGMKFDESDLVKTKTDLSEIPQEWTDRLNLSYTKFDKEYIAEYVKYLLESDIRSK